MEQRELTENEQEQNFWFEGCNLCNTGVCSAMERMINNLKLSERKAAQKLENRAIEYCKRIGEDPAVAPTAEQIRLRYRYYVKKRGGETEVGQVDPVEKPAKQETPEKQEIPESPDSALTKVVKHLLETKQMIAYADEAYQAASDMMKTHYEDALGQLMEYCRIALGE